jgi:hypothetical protein
MEMKAITHKTAFVESHAQKHTGDEVFERRQKGVQKVLPKLVY